MILEVKVNEITAIQLVIFFIVLLIFIIAMTIFLIYFHVKNKIHESFHKGYKESRNDEIFYFSTIKKLKDCFENILNGIRESEINMNARIYDDFANYKELLKTFQKKFN